jgi:hypothetical protein
VRRPPGHVSEIMHNEGEDFASYPQQGRFHALSLAPATSLRNARQRDDAGIVGKNAAAVLLSAAEEFNHGLPGSGDRARPRPMRRAVVR